MSVAIEQEEKLNREITQVFNKALSDKASSFGVGVNYFSTELKKTGKITFTQFLSDKMMVIVVIQHGIPYSLFNVIQEATPFSEKDWATFLDMSTKSLQRYKKDEVTFKPIHSEKIIEMAEVTKLGLEVFGNKEKFNLWLHTPSFALGNIKPFDLIGDSYGKELVVSELTRINYGIFA